MMLLMTKSLGGAIYVLQANILQMFQTKLTPVALCVYVY